MAGLNKVALATAPSNVLSFVLNARLFFCEAKQWSWYFEVHD
jgi:hypothetical protein